MDKKYIRKSLDTKREPLHLSDDEKRFAIIYTATVNDGQTIIPVLTVHYQYDNHLGSACLELDNTGQIISYEEYHPFGTTSYRSGRTETEVSLKRYKYCGKERDEETGLYYYGMRYYAAWICRFVSVDPLQFKYPYYTPYQYAGNKPITFIDLDGGEEMKPEEKNGFDSGRGTSVNPIMLDEVKVTTNRPLLYVVTTNSGKELFRIGKISSNEKNITVIDLYAFEIQWFEETANNYMPLVSISLNINSYSELKHFSWEEIADFAEKDRMMISYRSGGSGDWKASGKPGDGYSLVTVDGEPYWADAIGQIPFAVDKFTDELETTGNAEIAKKQTIEAAYKFGNGNLIGRESDRSNSYDNAMVKRAINWAEKRYNVIKAPWYKIGKYDLKKTNHSVKNLAIPSHLEQY